MTQLELLAAKIRGADSNADAADIIGDWYDSKVKHAHKNALESAEICRNDATKIGGAVEALLNQVANNFETTAKLMEFDRNE